jgi:cation:H+ antiporter
LSAGNLIGSDIFNFYGVMGMAGALLQPPLAQPVMVSPSLVLGVFMPIVVAIAVIAFMRTGMRIGRGEGAALVLLGIARWINDLSFG